MNYEKLSSLIYKILSKRRMPKKEWLLFKKMKIKKDKNFYIDVNNDITYKMYLYNSINKRKQILGINKKNNNIIEYSQLLYDNISNYEMYKILILFFSLYKNNLYNYYYLYLSFYCKIIQNKSDSIYIINTLKYNNNLYKSKSNSFNIFNFKNWSSKFIIEHNTNRYFHINNLMMYINKVQITLYNNILISNNNKIKYIFYLLHKFNNTQNKTYITTSKYINITQLNNNNISNKYNYLKFTKIINNNDSFMDPFFILQKKTSSNHLLNINKYIFKKYIKLLSSKFFGYIKFNNKNKYYNKIYYNSLFKRKYNKIYKYKLNKYRKLLNNPNNIDNIFKSLHKSNEQGKIIINNKYNNYIYYLLLYNKYQQIKNKNKIDIYNNSINKIKSKENKLIKLNKYNIIFNYNNILYNNKYNINIINKKKTNINISNNNIYGIYSMYKNRYLYNIYFDNNSIYKEILIEYLIRLEDKNNEYDGKKILDNRILFNVKENKMDNTGLIVNGINISSNLIKYSNNNKPSKLYNNIYNNINNKSIISLIGVYNILLFNR